MSKARLVSAAKRFSSSIKFMKFVTSSSLIRSLPMSWRSYHAVNAVKTFLAASLSSGFGWKDAVFKKLCLGTSYKKVVKFSKFVPHSFDGQVFLGTG